MKRALIWLTILVAPTLVWLTFTDSGRMSWRSLVSPDVRTANSTVINVEPSPKNDERSTPRQIVLIPAQPAPTDPSLRVQLSGHRTLGLIVTDPQDRRSGIDALKQTVSQEIPNSSAERITNRDSNGSERETIVVTIKPASSTVYSLEIAGKQAGEFHLAVGGVSPTLNSITEIVSGRVPADTSVHSLRARESEARARSPRYGQDWTKTTSRWNNSSQRLSSGALWLLEQPGFVGIGQCARNGLDRRTRFDGG